MDTNQPASQPIYAPASAALGMFGTKIPSAVAFGIAVLLFFMPFIDIKCNGTSLQTVSGLELATGFKMKNNNSSNSFLNDVKSDKEVEDTTKTDKKDPNFYSAVTKKDNKDANIYAMVAGLLAILGLILSFINAKAAIGGALVTGVASAGAMIGMMIDIKKKVKLDMLDTSKSSSSKDTFGLGKLGDSMKITVDFTPWFYIAVIALLAAAFFCYKRMQSIKS